MGTNTLEATAGSVTLATQSFGLPSDPAIVMIMGSTASMLGWPDELCFDLAQRGRFVIRYDHRDTGLSTTYPLGSSNYAVEDLVADLWVVMDAYDLANAHLVGLSLGGLIAQAAALTHPDRALTLTLIGSEPLGWDGPPLPHISASFLDHFGTMEDLDWSNADEVQTFLLTIEELCAGTGHPFDAASALLRVKAVMARSPSVASAFNHGTVKLSGDWTGRFKDIMQPVLVIHGEDDPVLPLPNGEALRSGISGARILVLPGIGHELPHETLPAIVDAVATQSGFASAKAHP